MAVVVRYFSTSSAGAADGTSWANRAALFSAGNWSTVITGFSFAASDSLECRIEGALSYTCGQTLASGLFANPPTAANPLALHGCDSSGNALAAPNPDWTSAQAPFSTTTLPTIATTTNINTVNLSTVHLRCLYFTSTGRQGTVVRPASADLIGVLNSASNISSAGIDISSGVLTNSFCTMSGASFDFCVNPNAGVVQNVRVNGSAGVTSGSRNAFYTSSAGYTISRCTAVGCAGSGAVAAAGAATRFSTFSRCSFINCGVGITCNSTASQTVWHVITGCLFANSSTYGIEGNGARVVANGNRLRDSTSGNFNGFGNYKTTDNYTTDSDDATEFVDSTNGDYRIKNTAATWGKNYGAGDQAAAGGGAIGGGNLNGGFQ